MTRVWLVLRSVVLWTVCWTFFVLAVLLVVVLSAFVGQRRIDPLVRALSRSLVRMAGARLDVRCAPGFQPARTCFLVSNHVNLFDPFVLYGSIPQFFRGLELESHFKVPVYGWFMKRFGNVPVPDVRTASGLKRTYRLAREALDSGVSLLVFPEASRTLDGRVGDFESGVFRMALNLGYPIVPVSLVHAFRWKRKASRLLRPATVEVHIHDAIDVAGLNRQDLQSLRERVRSIISAPVEASLSKK
ncbi:MAG: lysophospholipid acyltransferase family protein [Planctomycetota bacterium]|jgi:1-acyl-sn-glycerol-3-phosphate acyltransferase